MQSLNRTELIQILQIPSTELWAADVHWNAVINQCTMDWISEYFIPYFTHHLFTLCRKQMASMWKLFQNWLKLSGHSFDLREIKPAILIEFGKQLPSIGWSSSAIQLLEVILIKARQYFDEKQLIRKDYCLPKEYFTKKFSFPLSVEDFRIIRKFFVTEGNDYEYIYFELAIMDIDIQKGPAIQGKHIVFEGDYAYVVRDLPSGPKVFPCPKAVSKKLLILLRSRNILAEEFLFGGGSNKRPIVKEKIFKTITTSICEQANIPLFIRDSLYAFQKDFIWSLARKRIYGVDVIAPLVFPGDKPNLPLATLELLDEIYSKLVNEEIHDEHSYIPRHVLNTLCPQELCNYPEPGLKIGYARGTPGKDLEQQIEALKKEDCDFIFVDEIDS